MYRYIIVDDEVIIRKGLLKKIGGITSMELTCVGEAANGVEGLELIGKTDPDIIITDMRMRKMDGVEFLDQIGRHYPDKVVIVISSYKDFDYLNQAIESRVIGYVLKPFSTEEIEKQLKKAVDQIEYRKSVSHLEEKVDSFEYEKAQDAMRNAVMNHWDDGVREELSQYGCRLDQRCLLVTVHTKIPSAMTAARKLCDEILTDIQAALVANPLQKHQFFIILYGPIGEAKMKNKADHICGYLLKCLPEGKLFLCVSRCKENLMELHGLMLKNEKLLKRARLTDMRRILNAQEPAEKNKLIYSENCLDDWFLEMKYHPDKAPQILESFFAHMDVGEFTIGDIGKTCGYLIDRVNQYAVATGTETDDVMAVFDNRYLFCSSIEQMKRELSGYVILILHSIGRPVYRSEDIYEQVLEYIRSHCGHKLTLQSVAGEFYISAAYLSNLFKKNCEVGFNEYVTDIRIEKARQLLENSALSVERISDEVGYANPKYFFKIFKKETGCTPLEYRNRSKGG